MTHIYETMSRELEKLLSEFFEKTGEGGINMTDVLAVRNEYRLQSWMEIIRECEESGLSNREFCFQRGISEKTYYYWL